MQELYLRKGVQGRGRVGCGVRNNEEKIDNSHRAPLRICLYCPLPCLVSPAQSVTHTHTTTTINITTTEATTIWALTWTRGSTGVWLSVDMSVHVRRLRRLFVYFGGFTCLP